ncbi:hypothetical protein INT45_012392 [Circinella minor]|uniref:Yeast cell wall synthesis Kre9/Knh1-like N-terminal domain-containing protein n=1 Tax=Circinella minor TaxID=1195481 RepID=A0A8H7VFN9_9FUNG|nr:hypothetical protein INT45_012392 [Circinella minor]
MKFSITAIISATAIAVTSAQGPAPAGGNTAIVSITSPLTGTTYKAGSKAIISWINPSVETIPQIILARGPSSALQPIAQIGQNVNSASGRFEWEIPYDCTDGNDYAFELGQSPQLAFAGPFTIEGCTGGNFSSAGGNASASNSTPSSGGTSSSGSAPAGSSPSSGANANHQASAPAGQTGAGTHVIPGFIATAVGGLVTAYQLF